ncbi:hypothetical protein PUN28_003672 [Cardiocondyla obscurior]|uniref:Uncharacterized protein n=1 Tax=Cardiocondyla obscurior TaxID=286306 RepID=A0AAW2GKF8_9HYME
MARICELEPCSLESGCSREHPIAVNLEASTTSAVGSRADDPGRTGALVREITVPRRLETFHFFPQIPLSSYHPLRSTKLTPPLLLSGEKLSLGLRICLRRLGVLNVGKAEGADIVCDLEALGSGLTATHLRNSFTI